jgi:gliding motility-associated-like protein
MKKSITTNRSNSVIRKVLMLGMVAVLMSLRGIAQTDTEFWFAAPEIDSTHGDSSLLRFATNDPAIITVSIPANPSFTPVVFNMGAQKTLSMSWNNILGVNYKNSIENTAFDVAVKKGIHITATSPIVAYYEVATQKNADVFALKGKNALGKLFYATFQNRWHNKYPFMSDGDATYEFGTQDSLPLPWAPADMQSTVAMNSWSAIDIVATEDNTVIQITPTNPIVSSLSIVNKYGWVTNGVFHNTGVPYTVTLQKGETYSARAAYKNPTRRLSGTKIEVLSGGNIAVTSKDDGVVAWDGNASDGASLTKGWNSYGFDVIGDQMIPVNLIGDRYIITKGYFRVDDDNGADPDWDGESAFFTATVNNTPIYLTIPPSTTPVLVATINAGQTYQYKFSGPTPPKYIQVASCNTANCTGNKFYAFHVTGVESELAGAIIPTVGKCTGSTELAFTRAHNKDFYVNLLVRQGAESKFVIIDSAGNVMPNMVDPTKFTAVPGTTWSVYTDNDWTAKTTTGASYIISNTLDVFHLGILNMSEYTRYDSTIAVRSWVGGGDPNVKDSNVQKYWNDTSYTKTLELYTPWVSASSQGYSYWILTKTGSTIYVAFWHSKPKDRGAFYGYFSDFNEFSPFAAVPDANHPKCLGDTIQLTAAGGVSYVWTQPANLKFLDLASASNPRVIPQVAGSYTLKVFIQGFCAKDSTYTFVFNVVAKPVPTITGPANVCLGTGNQKYIVSLADTNGFGTATKTWTVVGGTIVSGQGKDTLIVNWTSTVSPSVSVSIDNKSCAIGTTTKAITISVLPTITLTSPAAVCSGTVVPQYVLTSTPSGANYTWSNSNPLVGLSSPSGSTSYIPSFTATNSGASSITSIISVTPTLGCVGTPSTYTVTVNPKYDASFNYSTSSFCKTGSNPTPTITGHSGGIFSSTTPGLNFVSTTTGQINLATSSIGTNYNVTYTISGVCPSSSTATVAIGTAPLAAFAYAGPYCKEDVNPNPIYNTGGGGGTFSATPTGLVFVSSATGQVNLAASTPGTYTVKNVIAATTDCAADSATTTIKINPTPTVTVPSSGTYCPGNSVPAYTFTSNVAGTITWSNDNTLIGLASGGTNSYAAFPAANTGNTSITGNIIVTPPSNGCAVKSGTFTITVNPAPKLNDQTVKVCELTTKSITVKSIGGSKPLQSGNWTIIGSTIGVALKSYGAADSVLTVTTDVGAGTSKFRYILPDKNGCTDTALVTIVTSLNPTIALSPATVCQNAALTLTPSITGTNNPKPVWSTSPVIPANQNTNTSVTAITSSSGNYTVEVILTDSIGCKDTSISTVTINPNPTVTISPATDVHICQNAPLAITAQSNPITVSYKWTGDVASLSSTIIATPQFTSSVTGSHAYTLSVTTTNSCFTTVPYNVIVDANPIFTLGTDTTACSGISTKITIKPTGGVGPYIYDWSDENGAFNLPHDNAPTYVKTIPGTYHINLTVTDSSTSCKTSKVMTVTINANPTVAPTGQGCAGTLITVAGNPTSGSGTYTKHEWSGTDVALLIANQTTANPTLQTSVSGPHYLHYKVTDSKGCIGEKDGTVTVNDLPKPVITGKPLLEVCAKVALPLTVTYTGTGSYKWTGTGATYLSSTTAQNPTFTSAVAGTYTLTVTTTDGNTCAGMDVISVTVNPLPSPVVGKDSVCVGDSKVLKGDARFSSYKWTGDVSILVPGDITSPSPYITTTASTIAKIYNLEYTVKDAKGCTDSIPVAVKVNALPAANAGTDIEYSYGDVLSLKGLPGTATQYLYTWTPKDSINGSNTTQNVTTLPLHSTFIFTLLVQDKITQCKASDDVKVTDTTGTLVVTIDATPSKICVGDTSHINVNVKGGKKPYLYTWSPTVEYQYPTIGHARVRPTTTTAYTITVKDFNGLIQYAYVTVTVNQLPTVTLINQEVCSKDTLHIIPTIVTQAGSSIANVLWTGSGTSGLHGITTVANVDFFNNTSGLYPLSLAVTDNNGCKNNGSMTVTINDLPVIAIQGDKPEICAGASVALSVNQTKGATLSSYVWTDVPSGHLASTIAPTNTYTSTVSGDVYLSVVDAKGCKGSANYHVIVNQNPTATIADAEICQDAILTLDGKPSGGSGIYSSHVWAGANVSKLTPVNTQTTSFNTSVAGIYSVNYAVVDSKTCTGNKTIQVVVNSLPSVSYSAPLVVCAGSPLTITAYPLPTATITKNIWIEPGKPLQGNSTIVTFKSDVAGKHQISYYVETNKGCLITDTLDITVKPKPTIKINPDKDTICANELDNLGSTYAGGTMTPLSFSWSTNPSSPDLLTSFDKQTTVFKKTDMGKADVQLIYVDQNLCSDTDKVSIIVNPNPGVTHVNSLHACQNQDLPLNVNPTNISGRTYTWTAGTTFLTNTVGGDGSKQTFKSNTVGSYLLKYKVSETSFGCEAFDSLTINVTASPVTMTENEKKCQGDPLQLDVSGMGATSYVWSGKGTNTSILSSQYSATPTLSTVNAGINYFTVTGTIGTIPNNCSVTATVTATVLANPTITGVLPSDSAYYQQKYQYTPIVTPVSGVSYAWTPIATFIDPAVKNAQTKPMYADVTNITFLVTETTSGCKASVNTKLFVRDSIVPKIITKPVCLGDSVELKGSATGGDANKIYTWVIDGVKYTGSDLKYLPTDTTVVKLLVSDKYDTVSTSSTVIVYPKPIVVDTTFKTCAGDVVNITLPGGGSNTYNWTGVGSQKLTSTTTSTSQFITSSTDASQLYHYFVQTKNAFGCTDTSTVDIKVNANPIIPYQDTVFVITGKSTTINLGSDPNYSYVWTPSNMFVDPTLGNVTTVNLTADATFTVKVTDKTTGCSHDTTIIIKVDPPITISISPVSTCKGGSVVLTAKVTKNKKAPTFTWTNQSGVVLQQGTSYSLTYTPTATTTVSVSVTDGLSSAVDSKLVTVYPIPSVSITPDFGTYVIGEQGRELTAIVTSGTGTSPYVYSWSANSPLVTIDQSLPDPAKIIFSSGVEGSYGVNVLIIDANNCRNTAQINPSVIKRPLWPGEFCQGSSNEFDIVSSRDLKWVVVMDGVKTEFIGTKNLVNIDSVGAGTITLYDLNDLNTPIYSHSFNVNAKPYVNFEYTPNTQISISDNVNFVNLSVLDINRQVIPNNLVFFWDFIGDQVYTSEEVNPKYSYDEVGKYQVTLIGLDTITRCRDTITKKLEVTPNPNCGLKFPNAFTPEDIKDNHFLPGYIIGIKDSGYDLKIFNRWGQLLYETNSKTGSWDGVYNNAVCKQDVYVYHCKAVCENGKELFINGDVTLIK